MDSTQRVLRRSSSFNPEAVAFNPNAGTFDTNMQEPGSLEPVASGGAEGSGQLTSVDVFTAATQHVEATEPTFVSAAFPQLPSTPLRQLVPGSHVYPWANELEHHAINLGLPIEPVQTETMASVAQRNGSRGPHMVQYTSPEASCHGQSAAARSVAQRVQPPGILFPHESRAHGLDGKLVQQALTRSLTAEDLAKHLVGGNFLNLDKDMAPITEQPTCCVPVQAPTAGNSLPGVNLGTSFPPSAQSIPRYPQVKTDISYLHDLMHPVQRQCLPPTAPRAMVNATNPHGMSLDKTFAQATRPNRAHTASSDQSRGSARAPNWRRHSSARGKYIPKPKRMDQGPEPSSADIYPEDAIAGNWKYHGDGSVEGSCINQSSKMPQLRERLGTSLEVHDAAAWPTPAEAKMGNQEVGRNTKGGETVPFPVLEPLPVLGNTHLLGHDAPVGELCNTRASVASTTCTRTRTRTSTSTMPDNHHDYHEPDRRPLSPGQLDGSRYGLKLYGIGHRSNDAWNPPAVKCRGKEVSANKPEDSWGAVPFRVRPLNRPGWGGWEWAHHNGWFEDED